MTAEGYDEINGILYLAMKIASATIKTKMDSGLIIHIVTIS